MASEIRVNKITNRSGLSTATWNDDGIDVAGIATAHNFKTGTTNVHSTGVELANVNTGGATATFGGPLVGSTGSFSSNVTISGNLGVAGTVTYEDVARVDATGISTFREGFGVGPLAGIALTAYKDGSIRTSGIITAANFYGNGANLTGIDATQIVTGNTSVQTVDTGSDGHIKINTEGSERLRILSDGKLMTQAAGYIYTSSSAGSLALYGGNTNKGGGIILSGGNSPSTGDIRFYAQMSQSSPAERLRITSGGNVNIGTVNNYVGGAPSSGAGKVNIYHTAAGGDDWAMQVRQDSGTHGNGIFVRAGNGSSKMALDVRAYDEANKLLQVNGAGHVLTPLQPRAMVKINSNTTISNAKVTNWATASFNVGSFWDESNKRFVAPVAGWYLFGGTFRIGAPGKIRVVKFNLQHYNSANQHTATYGGGIGGSGNYDGGSSGYDHPYVTLSNLIQMDHATYIELHLSEVACEHTSYIQVNNEQSCIWGMLIA